MGGLKKGRRTRQKTRRARCLPQADSSAAPGPWEEYRSGGMGGVSWWVGGGGVVLCVDRLCLSCWAMWKMLLSWVGGWVDEGEEGQRGT